MNNNDIEEEKLCRLISTEIYTTFISNKKLPDPKKKKNPNFNKINQHNKMSFSVDLKFWGFFGVIFFFISDRSRWITLVRLCDTRACWYFEA